MTYFPKPPDYYKSFVNEDSLHPPVNSIIY